MAYDPSQPTVETQYSPFRDKRQQRRAAARTALGGEVDPLQDGYDYSIPDPAPSPADTRTKPPTMNDKFNPDGSGGIAGHGGVAVDNTANPYTYTGPWMGFDMSRAGPTGNGAGSLKYDAMNVLGQYNPSQYAHDQTLWATVKSALDKLHPGQYEMDKDGNIMLTGTADGYIGARPENRANSWEDTNQPWAWQWMGYNEAHPGPAGEGSAPTGQATTPTGGINSNFLGASLGNLGALLNASPAEYQSILAALLASSAASGALQGVPTVGGK